MPIQSISKLLLAVSILLSFASCHKTKTEQTDTTLESLTQWEDQKFSMFIHWGLYSIPAGVWEGEQISGYSEQIKGHAKISTEEYEKLAAQFNPTRWNADSVALLAKKAGMKSIVITSKHHDGFSLFDTQYSTFDVVDATPYKKDILKDLSEACKRHNLKFGLYFSLIDWQYEGATPFVSVRNSDTIPPLHHQYNLNQIEELLTNYGQISEIWFDMGSPTYEQSKEMAALVKKLQPNCMISGRIWNDQGDFVVMGDNLKPDFKMGVPWQTPASMFSETWSYRSWQVRPSVEDKIKEKIHDLITVVSFGGNYLLNIGPKADGSIVAFENEVLEGVGEWLKQNGEAIYSSKLTAIDLQSWGAITAKEGKLYLHIFDFPESNKLSIEGFHSKIKKAYPLTEKNIILKTMNNGNTLEIDLSGIQNKDKYATVVVLEYDSELEYTPKNVITTSKENTFLLTWENATKLHSLSGHDYYSTKSTVVKTQWFLAGNEKKNYELIISHTNDSIQALKLTINGEAYLISAPDKDSKLKNELYTHIIQDVQLDSNKMNKIELSLKDQSNPHKGFLMEGMRIELR